MAQPTEQRLAIRPLEDFAQGVAAMGFDKTRRDHEQMQVMIAEDDDCMILQGFNEPKHPRGSWARDSLDRQRTRAGREIDRTRISPPSAVTARDNLADRR